MFVLITKAVFAYALGSLSGSLLLGRRLGFDIREAGSGNAGGTNALRTRGWRFALGVVVIDIGKGALAVWLALLLPTTAASPGLYVEALACGFAAVLGHVFPVFYGFRGGKGAATVVGTIAVLYPVALPPLLLVWLLVLGSTGYVGLATVLAGVSLVPLLWWLALRVDRTTRPPGERGLRRLAVAGLIVLVVQILLGGWVSTNYSALACPDFPTCQNSYWPQMDAKDAFILWRGLGIDYEGGVLDHPARVAIHFVHRLGAMVAALVLGFASIAAMRLGPTRGVRIAGAVLGVVLVCQLVLGPVMLIRALPLALATAHNAVAALLLLAVVALNRSLGSRAEARPAAQ